jgi:subtilisin family serine protease
MKSLSYGYTFVWITLLTACGGGGSSTEKPNSTIEMSKSINEPYFYQQWYLEKNATFYEENNIDSNASIHFGKTYNYIGKGVKVAVIDDGLDITHPELNNSIIATYDITTKTTNITHSSMREHHGTATTGIITANDNGIGIKGIASESQIIFLKHREGMSDSETIELFLKAKEFGADIINCSWGTYDVSESVKEVIQDLATNGRDGKGIIILFATGNDAQDMGNDESSIPEVIAVGSSDKENLRAWYSNYGKNIDVLAPGGDLDLGITTLDDIGEKGIETLDNDYLLAKDENSFVGTSASAPIVSGVIALMLEKDKNMTRIEVVEALKNKSDKIGNLDYVDGFNAYYGYGKINVGRLLE